MKKKIACVIGTRPEAIKMAPVISALRKKNLDVTVLATGQHSWMLDQALAFFEIRADVNLSVMEERQPLDLLTSRVLLGVGSFLDNSPQDLLLVHGDTTTTMAAAMAAFYRHIPVGHVEAGLRSGDMGRPFPEEANRIITDRLSTLWFAPTEGAAENLRREKLPVSSKTLFVTGNTVIDALFGTLRKNHTPSPELAPLISGDDPVILMTAHRRESWGGPLESICLAMKDILEAAGSVRILVPLHKNPSVRDVIQRFLADEKRVILCEPLDYPDFVWAMNRSSLILTDSGGVQEEASGLKKPVLVMRDLSERPEALDTGTALLVGTDRETIRNATVRILTDGAFRESLLNRGENPFGDGTASLRIADSILGYYEGR
ncbi:MAG: UDP-N-acetylglucosamine 2-epimerase (non-hydrolyzing) [Aminivibrio sp.]|uniref:non-hydrolyzing UDP-N-acetylglucosamine 2-epimerase n=1 Tax=Aminivibrio sp. TaxID=1872489 RepID=UPI002B1F037F|nr:UDP-N-acetylglucosamine 2-epimerase (non-hydrolyzing) [Aminivibrio sp.]MEA4953729.1 UDP-N-acetylglucosamine 2-epimerase (non-hydrolyzing) [Aminivibrio sp.]